MFDEDGAGENLGVAVRSGVVRGSDARDCSTCVGVFVAFYSQYPKLVTGGNVGLEMRPR